MTHPATLDHATDYLALAALFDTARRAAHLWARMACESLLKGRPGVAALFAEDYELFQGRAALCEQAMWNPAPVVQIRNGGS